MTSVKRDAFLIGSRHDSHSMIEEQKKPPVDHAIEHVERPIVLVYLRQHARGAVERFRGEAMPHEVVHDAHAFLWRRR